MMAYVSGPAGNSKLEDEIMVLCPHKHYDWTKFETEAMATGRDYRDLHVPIGSQPTAAQKAAASTLAADLPMNKWLGGFLVNTILREAMHSEVMAGARYHLSKFNLRRPCLLSQHIVVLTYYTPPRRLILLQL